jgi:hypothetical protein
MNCLFFNYILENLYIKYLFMFVNLIILCYSFNIRAFILPLYSVQ